MTSASPEVWLIYPKGNKAFIRAHVKSARAYTGWSYQVIPTEMIKSRDGRPIHKITPEDATNLYRSMHTRRIGVWQIGDASAPTIPNPTNNPRHYRPLGQFVRYKAFHFRMDQKSFKDQWDESLIAFGAWIEKTECEGESDPRCLPFHVFKTDTDKYDLRNTGDRKRFESDHRRQNSRRDGSDRLWTRPNAGQMHGREVLTIAGRELIQGFHWDVSSERKRRISNTFAVWEMERNGYVNVYPNAHIRGSHKARQVI